jgi:glycosyltransferase involved in cell wall biosynthesis
MVVVVPAIRAQIRALLHPSATTIVHAQHILAAQAALPLKTKRTRGVITVRDHWPWDMHATGMQMAGDQRTVRGVWHTLKLRGASWGARLLAPLYAWQMRQRAALIAHADLVIAVSAHMAARVRAVVPTANVHAVPNMVDVDAIQACVSTPPRVQVPAQYVLFVGKLSPNKGAQYLPELIRRIRPPAIVIAGDGPLQAAIVAAAAPGASMAGGFRNPVRTYLFQVAPEELVLAESTTLLHAAADAMLGTMDRVVRQMQEAVTAD